MKLNDIKEIFKMTLIDFWGDVQSYLSTCVRFIVFVAVNAIGAYVLNIVPMPNAPNFGFVGNYAVLMTVSAAGMLIAQNNLQNQIKKLKKVVQDGY